MQIYTRCISTFRSLFRKDELDRELDEELASYLEMLTEEKIRAGMSPEQARRAARIELGGMEQVKEKVRERRLGALADTVFLTDTGQGRFIGLHLGRSRANLRVGRHVKSRDATSTPPTTRR